MAEYIEREAAIEEFQTEGARFIYTAGGCRAIISRIRAVPAADVVEVRHGMWLTTPTGWVYCSVCGEEPPEETNARTKYCPNCGARMDGGQDNG